MASRSGLTGVAGEHYAVAELARRGFLVTLTRGNAPGIDLLAYMPQTRQTVACQVKATDGTRKPPGVWLISTKDDDVTAIRSDFFILIYFPPHLAPPQFSIAPSREVASFCRTRFERWVSSPGKKGQQRNPANRIRKFEDREGHWRDRWDLLLAHVAR
jgi:hypothetical protein